MLQRLIGIGLCLLSCVVIRAQFADDFSNDSLSRMEWKGEWDYFAINKGGWLQSQSSQAGEHVLWHASEAAVSAQWKFTVRISGSCSAYNMVRFYMVEDSVLDADGYFVQIGGGNKNVTLYRCEQGKTKKVIESQNRKRILSADAMTLQVRLERDSDGVFALYSQIENIDSIAYLEGTYAASYISFQQVGWWVKNSALRGYDFYLDDVCVSGVPQSPPIEPDPQEPASSSEDPAISLTSDCISPNGDGWEDEVCLQSSSSSEGWTFTATLYTATGVSVRGFPSFTEPASFCWDGYLANGSRASMGVYVLHVEARHTATKRVKRFRFGIAVV